MDERIANQVIYEKRKQQVENGAKLTKICSSVGRCPICTLKPPCNHRTKADQSIHPDLLAMSPQQMKKGLAQQLKQNGNSPNKDSTISPLIQQFPFALNKRGEPQLTTSIDSFGKPAPVAAPVAKKSQRTPYSILAGNSQEAWDAEKSQLESLMGNKTTRGQVLAQMHVKKRFQETLQAGKIQKMLNRQELDTQRALLQRPQQDQQMVS